MDQRQRIATQRALVQEALGKLNAVSEFFGTEDTAVNDDLSQLEAWQAKVKEFSDWVFDESPIA